MTKVFDTVVVLLPNNSLCSVPLFACVSWSPEWMTNDSTKWPSQVTFIRNNDFKQQYTGKFMLIGDKNDAENFIDNEKKKIIKNTNNINNIINNTNTSMEFIMKKIEHLSKKIEYLETKIQKSTNNTPLLLNDDNSKNTTFGKNRIVSQREIISCCQIMDSKRGYKKLVQNIFNEEFSQTITISSLSKQLYNELQELLDIFCNTKKCITGNDINRDDIWRSFVRSLQVKKMRLQKEIVKTVAVGTNKNSGDSPNLNKTGQFIKTEQFN